MQTSSISLAFPRGETSVHASYQVKAVVVVFKVHTSRFSKEKPSY